MHNLQVQLKKSESIRYRYSYIYSCSYSYPGSKSNIVDKCKNIRGAKVKERKECLLVGKVKSGKRRRKREKKIWSVLKSQYEILTKKTD